MDHRLWDEYGPSRCVSLVHRDFGVHLYGDCDSQGLILEPEGDEGADLLSCWEIGVMLGLGALITLAVGVCDTDE